MEVISNKTEVQAAKEKWTWMVQWEDKPFGNIEGKSNACMTWTHYGAEGSRLGYNIPKLELSPLKWDKIE